MNLDSICSDEPNAHAATLISYDAAQPRSLQSRLQKFVDAHGDLAFSGDDGRDLAHDIVQYPAMMVPKMQGGLLDCFQTEAQGRPLSVVDPFMGSGTILVEARRRGLAFRGVDINPYALLIAQVKSTMLPGGELDALRVAVDGHIGADTSTALDHDFPGRSKWFRNDVARALARIRRSIRKIEGVQQRRVLWACLGETVRVSSNSRTSTFKLHIRPTSEIGRDIDAFAVFRGVVSRAVDLLKRERSRWDRTAPAPELQLGDVRKVSIPRSDLLLSSPPYGDNGTTVPYGQFSYLALQWMDLADLPGPARHAVKNTHALDTKSLGGGLKNALASRADLEARSPALAGFLALLDAKDADNGLKRVVAFYRDLDSALERCVDLVKPKGHMVWTVGNRRVCSEAVPMDVILRELLEARGCTFVTDLKRVIPSKRMATKNSITDTMRSETVVVVRNG
ncbi:MAG: site-specific DNA-methyltransferase [Deltaproteobacteria bacterium]|nr:site-specific DNA-methyltransferase [Deltaproteobacteria bacterium]